MKSKAESRSSNLPMAGVKFEDEVEFETGFLLGERERKEFKELKRRELGWGF